MSWEVIARERRGTEHEERGVRGRGPRQADTWRVSLIKTLLSKNVSVHTNDFCLLEEKKRNLAVTYHPSFSLVPYSYSILCTFGRNVNRKIADILLNNSNYLEVFRFLLEKITYLSKPCSLFYLTILIDIWKHVEQIFMRFILGFFHFGPIGLKRRMRNWRKDEEDQENDKERAEARTAQPGVRGSKARSEWRKSGRAPVSSPLSLWSTFLLAYAKYNRNYGNDAFTKRVIVIDETTKRTKIFKMT